jgi:ABC-type lipoprotein release transport system permease subunit
MARNLLFRIGFRYLLHHPFQSALMILGITLGVAVVVAIDIANASASRAFDLSTEATTYPSPIGKVLSRFTAKLVTSRSRDMAMLS